MQQQMDSASHSEQQGEQQTKFECSICLDDPSDPVVSLCGHLYCWPCLYRWLNQGHKVCPVCKSGCSEETVIPIYGREKKRLTKPPRRVSTSTPKEYHPESTPNTTYGRTTSSYSDSAAASSPQTPEGQASGPYLRPGFRPSTSSPSGCRSSDSSSIPSRPQGQRSEARRSSSNGSNDEGGANADGPRISFFTAGFGFFPSLFSLQFQIPRGRPVGQTPNEEEIQRNLESTMLLIGIVIILFLLFM